MDIQNLYFIWCLHSPGMLSCYVLWCCCFIISFSVTKSSWGESRRHLICTKFTLPRKYYTSIKNISKSISYPPNSKTSFSFSKCLCVVSRASLVFSLRTKETKVFSGLIIKMYAAELNRVLKTVDQNLVKWKGEK